MTHVDRWTTAWLAACVVVAIHVVDESLHGDYGLYADVSWLLSAVPRWLELPPFRPEVWATNVIGAIIILFALGWLVWIRRGPMVAASYAFAAFVTANGILHLLGAAALKTLIPGTWTAPLMIAAGLFLFVSAGRNRGAAKASDMPV